MGLEWERRLKIDVLKVAADCEWQFLEIWCQKHRKK